MSKEHKIEKPDLLGLIVTYILSTLLYIFVYIKSGKTEDFFLILCLFSQLGYCSRMNTWKLYKWLEENKNDQN